MFAVLSPGNEVYQSLNQVHVRVGFRKVDPIQTGRLLGPKQIKYVITCQDNYITYSYYCHGCIVYSIQKL